MFACHIDCIEDWWALAGAGVSAWSKFDPVDGAEEDVALFECEEELFAWEVAGVAAVADHVGEAVLEESGVEELFYFEGGVGGAETVTEDKWDLDGGGVEVAVAHVCETKCVVCVLHMIQTTRPSRIRHIAHPRQTLNRTKRPIRIQLIMRSIQNHTLQIPRGHIRLLHQLNHRTIKQTRVKTRP